MKITILGGILIAIFVIAAIWLLQSAASSSSSNNQGQSPKPNSEA